MTSSRERGGRAAQAWAERVRAEHEQAERVRGLKNDSDYWQPFAHRFTPQREGEGGRDPSVDALLELVHPGDTVLDVGAGGGRIAIPLAAKCRHVVAVEPSEAMRNRMAEQAKRWGVKNLTIVASNWEEAEVGPADIAVCSHVLYTVADPVLFIRKLGAHARRLVAVIMFEQPAMASFFPLWLKVHGEERLALPALAEFTALLEEMGVRYKRTRLPLREPRGFESVEQAISESAARLFVSEGTPQATRLEKAVREALVPRDGMLKFHWGVPQKPWLVTWMTGRTGQTPGGPRQSKKARPAT